jgi:hypothetical protein
MTTRLGTADDQRRFWQNTSPGGRALLGAAVFSLFATLGFLTDVTELGRSSPLRLAVITLLAGGGALAYAVVAFRNMKWMPLVVALHVALSVFVPRLIPLEPALIAEGAAATRLIDRLRVNVIGASLCIAAGYSFFVVFFIREGHRYYRLHTELALAATSIASSSRRSTCISTATSFTASRSRAARSAATSSTSSRTRRQVRGRPTSPTSRDTACRPAS